MSNKCVNIIVSGIVQGVFFRAAALRKAKHIGVTGWVKNLPDGRVELMVEGEEILVNQMIVWCKKGPMGAKVENVDIEVLPYLGELSNFKIRY